MDISLKALIFQLALFNCSSSIKYPFIVKSVIIHPRGNLITAIYYTSSKAWSPCSWNGRKHRSKHVSDSVPSSSDTREHFDCNIASLSSIVINCSVSSSCNDCSNHWRHGSSLVSSCIANLNQRDMAKQLLTPLRLISRINFSSKNYSCLTWPERSRK